MVVLRPIVKGADTHTHGGNLASETLFVVGRRAEPLDCGDEAVDFASGGIVLVLLPQITSSNMSNHLPGCSPPHPGMRGRLGPNTPTMVATLGQRQRARGSRHVPQSRWFPSPKADKRGHSYVEATQAKPGTQRFQDLAMISPPPLLERM